MKWHNVVMWITLYGLLVLNGIHAKIIEKRGVLDNFNDGLKAAGQMFGINTAADVADLVAKAFSNNNPKRKKPDLFSFIQSGLNLATHQAASPEENNNDETQESVQQYEDSTAKEFPAKPPSKDPVSAHSGTPNLIATMLRMVGFDASKLGALAINALVMIASAIGNAIMGTATSNSMFSSKNPPFGQHKNNENIEEENVETGPEEQYSSKDHQPRRLNDIATVEWFLQNSSAKMKRVLKEAIHSDLADKITDMITNHETRQGQASCLKMLVCKSSPFIWGMQKSIKERIDQKDNKARKSQDDDNSRDKASKRLLDVRNLFTHLPTVAEYQQHGEKCEQLYSTYCNTTDLFNKKN